MYVKINGETHYLWRAVDHEGEILESYVTKAGQIRSFALPEEGAEAARQDRGHCHRRASFLPGGDA